MKKAQAPIIFISVLLIVVGVLLWGVGLFDDVGKSTRQVELDNFARTLERAVQQQARKFDSVEELSLALPRSVETVCLTDPAKDFNQYADIQLSKTIDNFPNSNLFLSPYENFISFSIPLVALEKSPLCLKNDQGKVDLKLTGRGNATLIQGDSNSIDCTQIIAHGDPDSKIDVVFLGHAYDDPAVFETDINDYVNVIFRETEPFRSAFHKLNFYRVDDFSLQCDTSGYVACDRFQTNELASNCPNDFVIALTDRSKVKDSILPLRSSAVSNLASINTADNKLVAIHEFAHIFADLADEYVDDSYYKNFDVAAFPNCDFPGCDSWANLTEGCFAGCSVSQFHRATEKSIMLNYLKSNEFGIVNQHVLQENIDVYN